MLAKLEAGRAKRLLAYVETRGTIVCRMDYRGNRIVALPALNCETGPGDPKAPLSEGKLPAEAKATAPPQSGMPGLFAAE